MLFREKIIDVFKNTILLINVASASLKTYLKAHKQYKRKKKH